MTRLKAMDGTNHVFTVTFADGQLLLSVPIAAIENHDDFVTWANENVDCINEVCNVAIENEVIAVKEQAVAQPEPAQS